MERGGLCPEQSDTQRLSARRSRGAAGGLLVAVTLLSVVVNLIRSRHGNINSWFVFCWPEVNVKVNRNHLFGEKWAYILLVF